MGFKKNDPCLAKVSDDEPIFVFRAQDQIADRYVDAWADDVADFLGEEHPKVVEARACAAAMRKWPTRKLPD